MVDAILYPGPVTARSFPDQCTIVGNGQQWADTDDATYVRVDGLSGQLAVVQASLPQAGFIPANCSDVQLYARASANTSSSTGQGVQVTIWDDAVRSQIGGVGSASHLVDGVFTTDETLIADGTIHDYLYRWSDVDSSGTHSFELFDINSGTPTWDPPSFAQWVLDHPTLILGSLLQPGWLTYYEMWVILVGASAVTRGPGPAPCRLYPRDDDLGVGVGHLWPPPRTNLPGGYV